MGSYQTLSYPPGPGIRLQPYDESKSQEEKLFALYEVILSCELNGSQGTDNAIAVNEAERRAQMDRLLQVGLEKTAKLDKVGKKMSECVNIVLSVKNTVGSALQMVPVAAGVWAGVFANPIAEMKTNRDGIIHVVRSMKWYSGLSALLLDENAPGNDERTVELRELLTELIRELYKTILKYIVKSICAYNRNPVLSILRNVVKLDDWSGSLDDVTKAEKAVKGATSQYGHATTNSHLEHLVNFQVSKDQIETIEKFYVTDMSAEIKSLQERKDALFSDSYQWVLGNKEYLDFTSWQPGNTGRLLWIKGDPGKGKTMLVIGIVKELTSQQETHFGKLNLWYFFCQGTNDRFNTVTAVVKGLIWMLLGQEISLVRHCKDPDSQMLKDTNAFYSLKKILQSMLEDPVLQKAYLVVYALDECGTDERGTDEHGLRQLLDLIAEFAGAYTNVRWLVSSRNDIEWGPSGCAAGTRLSLELNADSVAGAVTAYIDHKMQVLAEIHRPMYAKRPLTIRERPPGIQDKISSEITEKAGGTFLWVALVFREIERCDAGEALKQVREIPSGLDEIYARMMRRLTVRPDAQRCRDVLQVMMNAYAPMHFSELASLAALPDMAPHEQVVRHCGLLTIKEDDGTVFFVHQSAKDFLMRGVIPDILRTPAEGHRMIMLRALEAMTKTLRRNIYDIGDFGCFIDDIGTPDDDHLLPVRYSCNTGSSITVRGMKMAGKVE